MRELIMYGSEHCHLCKKAKDILQEAQIYAANVDITNNKELIEKYGERIPVLRRVDNGTELGWPFDLIEVVRFLY